MLLMIIRTWGWWLWGLCYWWFWGLWWCWLLMMTMTTLEAKVCKRVEQQTHNDDNVDDDTETKTQWITREVCQTMEIELIWMVGLSHFYICWEQGVNNCNLPRQMQWCADAALIKAPIGKLHPSKKVSKIASKQKSEKLGAEQTPLQLSSADNLSCTSQNLNTSYLI